MIVSDGPGLFLEAADCALLDKALRDALKFGWLGRRAIPPHALVKLADTIHAVAAEYRPECRTCRLNSGTGTDSAPTMRTSATSEETEVPLTTTEAARYLGKSTGYLRRLARESAIPADTGAGGNGWRFQRNELDAWNAHREETRREAA